jgi:hypothetical protein
MSHIYFILGKEQYRGDTDKKRGGNSIPQVNMVKFKSSFLVEMNILLHFVHLEKKSCVGRTNFINRKVTRE